jgi:hypothetical protein
MALETEVLWSSSGLLCSGLPTRTRSHPKKRAGKDWAAADQARAELAEKGIVVIDTILCGKEQLILSNIQIQVAFYKSLSIMSHLELIFNSTNHTKLCARSSAG